MPTAGLPGDTVRALRKRKGWTQADLGLRAKGINKAVINRLETGGNSELKTLRAVAGALGVDVSTLFRPVTELQPAQNFTESPPGVDGNAQPNGSPRPSAATIPPSTERPQEAEEPMSETRERIIGLVKTFKEEWLDDLEDMLTDTRLRMLRGEHFGAGRKTEGR